MYEITTITSYGTITEGYEKFDTLEEARTARTRSAFFFYDFAIVTKDGIIEDTPSESDWLIGEPISRFVKEYCTKY